MHGRRLRALILVFLWGALIEDSLLVALAWFRPETWFHAFHGSSPTLLEIALLRRSAGQWAGFAVAQALALARWRRQPAWLVFIAGVRFSDLFTDAFYILSAPMLTTFGWCCLLPPPVLNAVGIAILLAGYRRAGSSSPAASDGESAR